MKIAISGCSMCCFLLSDTINSQQNFVNAAENQIDRSKTFFICLQKFQLFFVPVVMMSHNFIVLGGQISFHLRGGCFYVADYQPCFCSRCSKWEENRAHLARFE